MLEDSLKASNLVPGGFMDGDIRPIEEIIEEDAVQVRNLGRTPAQIAARMQKLSALTREFLGSTVHLDLKRVGFTIGIQGQVYCPWPHVGAYFKDLTTITRTDTGESVRWSDLCTHFIGDHGFFMGLGSPYRLDPTRLVRVLFG
jgi:hypothetical protein